MEIRPATPIDAPQIADIYNHYIRTSHATFETDAVDPAEIQKRILEILEQNYPYFVCEENDEILGYTYGHEFRPRRAYRHSIETSIYIKSGSHGLGIGSKLYQKLLDKISEMDIHAVIG